MRQRTSKPPRLRVVSHTLDNQPRRVLVFRIRDEWQDRDDTYSAEVWTVAEWNAMHPAERSPNAGFMPGIGYVALKELRGSLSIREAEEAEREMLDAHAYRN